MEDFTLLTLDHGFQAALAGVIVEALRRFGRRLDALEVTDKEMAKEVHLLELAAAEKYATRDEISRQHKDMRLDMKEQHDAQMVRMADILSALKHRVDKLEDRADHRG